MAKLGRPRGWHSPLFVTIERMLATGKSAPEIAEEAGVTPEYVNIVKRRVKGIKPRDDLRRVGGLNGRSERTLEIERDVLAGTDWKTVAEEHGVTRSYVQMVAKRIGLAEDVSGRRFRVVAREVQATATSLLQKNKEDIKERRRLAARAKRMRDKGLSWQEVSSALGKNLNTLARYIREYPKGL